MCQGKGNTLDNSIRLLTGPSQDVFTEVTSIWSSTPLIVPCVCGL
jgi:hypothetical protein